MSQNHKEEGDQAPTRESAAHGETQGVIAKELLESRTIMLDGEMDDALCGQAFRDILYLNTQSQEPIKLYINSGGGSLWAMRFLANGISASGAPVIGIVAGRAFSAAAVLLQVCAKRLVLPHATLLFHEVMTDIDGYSLTSLTRGDMRGLIAELQQDIKALGKDQKFCDALVVARSGIDIKQLRKKYDQELSAREALKLGLIDEIVTTL